MPTKAKMLHSMVWLRAQRCCPGPLRQPHQGQSFQPHPSFAFSWFDSADQMATHWAWQLCRPNINPLGLNFARRAVTCRLRIRSGAGASGPAHPLLLAGSKVPEVSIPLLLAGSKVPKRHRLCWGSAVSDARRRRTVTCRLRMRSKAKASSPTHPLLLAGS